MTEHSRPYAIHSDEECERLELQARLAKIDGHLKYLSVLLGDALQDPKRGYLGVSKRNKARVQAVGAGVDHA